VKYEAIVKPHEPLPEAALAQGCGGGTSIHAAALTRALTIVESHRSALCKSDVVLVTDGGSDPSTAPELRRAAERLSVTFLGLGIGVSVDALSPWCSDVYAIEDLTSLDSAIATSLFRRDKLTPPPHRLELLAPRPPIYPEFTHPGSAPTLRPFAATAP